MTKNREKMVEFYQKIFGLSPSGFGGAIYMSDGDVNIALTAGDIKRGHQPFRLRGWTTDDIATIKGCRI
jgi:hypothetical protein